MKHLLLIASMILIAACETTPPPIEFTFENFELIEASAEYPDELGKIKDLECYPGEGDDCKVAGYSSGNDIDALEAYKIRAEGNTEIAQGNAEAVDLLLAQQAELVAAGIASENIQKIREEQLAWEKQERQREKWYYRLMLVLVGAAGVYASQ